MKDVYILLLIAASAYTLTSCKEKTAVEKMRDKMEKAGEDIKDAADDAGDEAEKESKKAKKKLEDISK